MSVIYRTRVCFARFRNFEKNSCSFSCSCIIDAKNISINFVCFSLSLSTSNSFALFVRVIRVIRSYFRYRMFFFLVFIWKSFVWIESNWQWNYPSSLMMNTEFSTFFHWFSLFGIQIINQIMSTNFFYPIKRSILCGFVCWNARRRNGTERKLNESICCFVFV